MKLVMLGTTGYHPNERRHTMCLLLPEVGIMLDAGTGAFRLPEYLVTDELDIFLSHTHLDHVVGLTFLHGLLAGRDMRRVTVHALVEKIAALRTHLFAEAIFPVAPPWEFRPLDGTPSLPGDAKMTWFPLKHPGGSVGFRFDFPNASIAYVTDTTAAVDAPYVEQIQGVDLLIHECYLPDEQADWAAKTGHSHITPVAEVAKKCGAGRLVVVHMDPANTADDPIGLDTARRIFARTELGEDRMEIDF